MVHTIVPVIQVVAIVCVSIVISDKYYIQQTTYYYYSVIMRSSTVLDMYSASDQCLAQFVVQGLGGCTACVVTSVHTVV